MPESRLIVVGEKQFSEFLAEVLSEADFTDMLRRERLLTDRSGVPFAVIVVAVKNPADGEAIRRFADDLRGYLRRTDMIGFLSHGRIGVLLPATSAARAKGVVERISAAAQLARMEVPPDGLRMGVYPDKRTTPGGSRPSPFLPIEGSPPTGPPLETDSSELEGPERPSDGHGISRLTEAGSKDFIDVRPMLQRSLAPWKRAIDIFGSAGLLLLLSPLLLLLAAVVMIGSPGPVLFRQPRLRRGRDLFTMFKFRTFRINASQSWHAVYVNDLIRRKAAGDRQQPMRKRSNEEDIVPLGKTLRRWGLDELPQLVNVLRGEMTLVGPRPEVPYAVQSYALWHHQRLDVTPGITGLWQVSGKNSLTFEQMVRLDIRYAVGQSLRGDLTILAKTIPALVSYNRTGTQEV